MNDSGKIFVAVSKQGAWAGWVCAAINWTGQVAVLWFNYAYLGNGWVLNLAVAAYIIGQVFGLSVYSVTRRKWCKTTDEAVAWLKAQEPTA